MSEDLNLSVTGSENESEKVNELNLQTEVTAEESVNEESVKNEIIEFQNEEVQKNPAEAEELIQAPEIIAEEIVAEIPETEEVTTETIQEIEIPDTSPNEVFQNENENIIETETLEIDDNEELTELIDIDFSNLTKEELVSELRQLTENEYSNELKNKIDVLRINFYKILRSEIEAQKTAFVSEGNNAENFKPEPDSLEIEFKELLNDYKSKKVRINQQLEQEKIDNLEKKKKIIEEIKELTSNQESINKTFNDFRELQRKWSEIGLVPQNELKNLWETYHYHVEKFYDYIKINRELRDLDMKRNLDEKIKLCEKAEELFLEPDIVKAFKLLQKFHDQWREIGPVPLEKKEEIWERFKEATSKINKKHQEYFETMRLDQENNLKAKTALCEKAEEIAASTFISYKDWDEKTNEVIELQKLWKTVGFATRKDNSLIYDRFRVACDNFFNKKRVYFTENKEDQNNNLQLKTDLCIQAESLKDSTDWKKTTEDFIKLQEKWKTIGPVPRKQSDVIWKRFRTACNFFFDNKTKYFSSVETEYEENLKLKQELIEKVESYELTDNNNENLETLKGFQKEWMEIGHVPIKVKEKIQKRFREAVNKHFDNLKFDENKRSMFLYKQHVDSINHSNKSVKQIRGERERIINNIKQLEADIVLLENNIGFFAKTKNAEVLINDVRKKIENAKKIILMDKQKLEILNKAEN